MDYEECRYCLEIIENNKVYDINSNVLIFCKNCFDIIKEDKKKFIYKLLQENCLASIKRMLIEGIPYLVFNEYSELYDEKKNEINNIYDILKREKIIHCNFLIKKLFETLAPSEIIDNNNIISIRTNSIQLFEEFQLI